MTTASVTWNTPGTYTWTAPSGLTHLDDTQATASGGGGGQGAGNAAQQTTVYSDDNTYSFHGTHVGGQRFNHNGPCWQSCDNWQQTGSQFFFATFGRSAMVNDLTGATINQVELFAANISSHYNSGAYLRIGYATRTDVKTTTQISDINTGGFPTIIDKVFWGNGFAGYHTVPNSVIMWFLDPQFRDNQGNWANSLLFGDDDTQNLNDFGSWSGAPGQIRLRVTYTQNTIAGGGGGGGAGFARKANVGVTQNTTYTIKVAAAGTGGVLGGGSPSDGDESYFAADTQVVKASGGAAGEQGDSSGSGLGGTFGTPEGLAGSDYDTGTSFNGQAGAAGTSGHGGFGGASSGAGGAQQNSLADGNPGTSPGGGGGGGRGSNDGGDAGDGSVFIQWTIPNLSISSSDSASAASDVQTLSHATQTSPETAGVNTSTGEKVSFIKVRDG